MSDKGTDHTKRRKRADGKQLLGKVVLLVGDDTAVMQRLITQLVQRGADIALLCWQIPLETARKLQENAKALGRGLLLIEQVEQKITDSRQLIDTVVAELGHPDIFIDLSTKRRLTTNGNIYFEKPNWQLTKTVLEEIVY